MDSLRLLIIGEDSKRIDTLVSMLSSVSDSALTVPNVEEALEALGLQRFDAVLLACPTSEFAEVEARLRECQAAQRASSPVHLIPVTPDTTESQIVEALTKLDDTSESSRAADLPVFQTTEFEDQCGGEPELMIEIVNLFMAERETQMPQLCDALITEDYHALARLAHTLKGSFASLHAPLAWDRAQALELAAKDQKLDLCQDNMMALEAALEGLEPELLAFRQACLQR